MSVHRAGPCGTNPEIGGGFETYETHVSSSAIHYCRYLAALQLFNCQYIYNIL